MRFCHKDISGYFEIDTESINTIVIENSRLFREITEDIYRQIDGFDGNVIMEKDGKLLDFSKNAEIFTSFVPFEINRKNLITKITSAIEKEAINAENYEMTMRMLSETEQYMNTLCEAFDCNIIFSKLAPSSIIKAVGVEIEDDYTSLAEKIIDYMELVREFDRDKLFFTVNLRSYIDDKEMELFMDTVLGHDLKVVMIENKEYNRLEYEIRRTIDADLCEF